MTGHDTGTGEALRGKPRFAAAGFTFIEVIIVFTLIGILVGLGIPSYTNAVRKSREAILKEDLFMFRKLIDYYYHDKGVYPPSLQALVTERYLRMMTVDPITHSSETWVEVRETYDPADGEPPLAPGVIDVHSGSDQKAIDGTLYNTW